MKEGISGKEKKNNGTIALKPQALKYFRKRREDLYSFQDFLKWEFLARFSKEIKRPLSEQEIRLIIGFDVNAEGDNKKYEICTEFGKQMKPVRWLDLGDQLFILLVKKGMSMKQAIKERGNNLREFGCYFPNGDRYKVFSGSLYGKNKRYSPLVKAYKRLGYGFSRKSLEKLQIKEKALIEEQQNFGWNSTVFHFL